MQLQTAVRRTLGSLRPFAHLAKSKKSSPRDSGPNDDVDEKDKKSGPTSDNSDDDLDAGADADNDDLETKPNNADRDDDEDDDDEDDDEADEKADAKAVKAARAAGHGRALAAAARQARRAERARGAAIFGSAHAAGRIEQAAGLAFHSLLSASAAITALAHSPRGRSVGIDSTPGQRLMAATVRLADEQLGRRATERIPYAAEDRAMRHRLEFARVKLKAVGSKHGLGLLEAVARVPPPPRGF